VLESNRDLVLRRLLECLGRDRTRHQVAEVTSLGLVQMTRKRVGEGLLESFSETCKACGGSGVILTIDPVAARRPAKPAPSGGAKPAKRAASGRSTRGASTGSDQATDGPIGLDKSDGAAAKPARKRRTSAAADATTEAPATAADEQVAEPAAEPVEAVEAVAATS